ncbi:formate dehydrogenase [Actinoplanes sp. HUAS TT8]|uniref:formate dehydrogenase n=1 Tax=Actinoplanes sp. HUAS TT8 TaxID=3447453 RepID=UPI003F5239F8
MGIKTLIQGWPVYRQLTGDDPLGRGAAAKSEASARLSSRTGTADRVVKSVCPYCAVGCGQNIYVKGDEVVQIEGDPDSPVSRGRLCPKGSATLQLTTGPRERQVLYRRPYGKDWEVLDLETAMEMVAERVLRTRADTWEWSADGKRTRRTLGIASLGGATLDNEENYLIKKLFVALGIVQVENQARVCHSSTVAGLGTSFGRGGGTTYLMDLQHSDCILIEGSNFAEAHPVGFQWVMEAKARGATVIHVDPRFSRTSALADVYVPIRAGTDIAWLGAIIKHVLDEERFFREYVVNYTNAATIVGDDFEDTEDLDGVFSGLDESSRSYDPYSWSYDGVQVGAASGNRSIPSVGRSGHGESHGAGGAPVHGEPKRDETLQHPRCVFQILKRHYSRYTEEMVEQICGVPREQFRKVCDLLTANSGKDRTTAFAYAVGWTQHTVGTQYIRTASILQLLLGNIGRPGGGILALRGHASIQGSSDIPTLFDLLPGYIPMPHAERHEDLNTFIEEDAASKGYWANMRAYVVSLLKAYWGSSATAENDFHFDYLPRITGSHSTYETVLAQLDGLCRGYFLVGENPAVGSANGKMQRRAMANLDWLVVRDFQLIESATWWKDGPEVKTGEMSTEEIKTEVFFFPAAAHTEKSGSFTNTNRMLQWHHEAIPPAGDRRSDLWFFYHLGRMLRDRLAASTDPRDRPLLDLTWDYPTSGPHDEPSAEAVLAEINGWDADGGPLSTYEQLKDDGSTACGCWIYCGVYQDAVNQSARRKPWREQSWTGSEWGWAWPLNRRTLYSRASADLDGKPWSERKALVWWDPDQGKWAGHDVADFPATKAPDYRPPEDAKGVEAISGIDPFIMQSDGKGWLYAPAGLTDGPMPTHYEPEESPVPNLLYPEHPASPVRELNTRAPDNLYAPNNSKTYPYVVTTYRLTEHFTAGGMTRWLPYLAELQPEFFCEVSPELARERGLEHLGWATIVSARNAIEARVLVTERMTPLTLQGRTIHQIGMPYHWGPNGLTTGDSVNDLSAMALDANTHIQEVKAWTADIRPGRRPRGPALPAFVAGYRRRAGVTEHTGQEI